MNDPLDVIVCPVCGVWDVDCLCPETGEKEGDE